MPSGSPDDVNSGSRLRQLHEADPELERKAKAWSVYFEKRGVKRNPGTILDTWARLESGVPPWPPTR